MKFTFGEYPVSFGKSFPQPKGNDFLTQTFKYFDYRKAYQISNQFVRGILDEVILTGGYKKVLVDVKIHDLKVGECPCIPGWHCDSVTNPFHNSRPESHHLFVTGFGCLTKFIKNPIELDINTDYDGTELANDLKDQLKGMTIVEEIIPACTIVNYGRFNFHSGNFASLDEKRILIRVTETDVVKRN